MRISIIGAGAWGTALAIHFAQEHDVTLYTRSLHECDTLKQDRENRRLLPVYAFPDALKIAALENFPAPYNDLVIVATPTANLREVLLRFANSFNEDTTILAACKGFERDSGLLPHQVIAHCLPQIRHFGLLSGPSFAQELAAGLPCAVCLAADGAWIGKLAATLNNQVMRLYASTDPIGVGVGGAVKNVMAIAAGVIDGLNYGLNARAALITRGLVEMQRLAVALGGNASTLNGLAGTGDLVLTATGGLSRNRRVGLMLAKNQSIEEILQSLGHVAEGVYTVAEVVRLANLHQVDMPITRTLNALLQGEIAASAAVNELMQREPRFEDPFCQ